jgi:predicted nucleic acid-binding Zn ribbon protein
MRHCFGCKISESDYNIKIYNSGLGVSLIEQGKPSWFGHYCYHCRLERKKLKDQVRLGKKPLIVNKICSVCNNSFKQKASNQSYCSSACSNKDRWKRHKDNRPKKHCIECNKELSTELKYCSNLCKFRHGYTTKPRVSKKIQTPCIVCSKLSNNKKFCSRSCSSIHSNLNKKPKVIKIVKTIKIKECSYCKNMFETLSHIRVYCSKKCTKGANKFKHKQYDKIRELKKTKRVPKWANKRLIEQKYKDCPPGFHVDHIIPLNGKDVCGFHVEYNLQHLSPEDNTKKSNQFDGTYDNNSWSNKK